MDPGMNRRQLSNLNTDEAHNKRRLINGNAITYQPYGVNYIYLDDRPILYYVYIFYLCIKNSNITQNATIVGIK